MIEARFLESHLAASFEINQLFSFLCYPANWIEPAAKLSQKTAVKSREAARPDCY